MFLSDSKGKKSLTVTLAVVAFVVVMLKILANNAAIQVGGFSYSFGSIDSSTVVALLGPTLGAYVGRRYTAAKYGEDAQDQATGGPLGTEDVGGKPGDGKE